MLIDTETKFENTLACFVYQKPRWVRIMKKNWAWNSRDTLSIRTLQNIKNNTVITIVSTEQTIPSIYYSPSIYTTLHRGGIHAQLLILTYHIQGRYSCPSSPPYTEKVFMLILTSHIQRRYSCSSSPPNTETVFMLINYRTFYSDPVMLSPSPKQTKNFIIHNRRLKEKK